MTKQIKEKKTETKEQRQVSQGLELKMVIEENCKITNNSNIDLSQLENIVSRFYPYVKEKLNFNHDAEVNLVSDPENSKDPWGKTAYYDPATMSNTYRKG